MKKQILYSAVFVLALAAIASVADAQTTQTPGFVPLAQTPNSPVFQSLYDERGSLAQYLNTIFKVALSVGAILAVLRIAYAGYLYMGTDLWSTKGKAKEILGDVVLGMLLLLSIYLILWQINPNILNLNILIK